MGYDDSFLNRYKVSFKDGEEKTVYAADVKIAKALAKAVHRKSSIRRVKLEKSATLK